MLTEEEYNAWLNLKRFPAAQFSQLFIAQLKTMLLARGFVDDILQEVEALEGQRISNTKKPSKYRKPPLQGFWHKHFFLADYYMVNICHHLQTLTGDHKKLEEIVKHTQKLHKDPEARFRAFVGQLIAGSYEERAGRHKLTGEWIVFAKYENRNYYLTLAEHNEGNEVIYRRLWQGCQPEFPFLFNEQVDPA